VIGALSAIDEGPQLSLDAFLERERDRVEAALLAAADELVEGVPSSLDTAIRYALVGPGKRLRPVLCAAAWRACAGEPSEAVYRLGAAVEVVHTYSLVHDDLPCMDDDALRRGRPTVHRAFGVQMATLVGAALIPAAARLAQRAAAELGLDAGVQGRLVVELSRAAGSAGMVAGQLMDLAAEERPVDAIGLEAIHRRKTGALLGVSLRLGAIAAGAGEPQLAALSVYGRELGLAFQIVDDVLDVTSTADALGKTAGKDAAAGKSTYPGLYGVEGARALAAGRAGRAVTALRRAGVHAPELEALARFVLTRES
jgi:geranylgeranyl diphosphate synthase, type II